MSRKRAEPTTSELLEALSEADQTLDAAAFEAGDFRFSPEVYDALQACVCVAADAPPMRDELDRVTAERDRLAGLLRRALDSLAAHEARLCDDDREDLAENDPMLAADILAALEPKGD